jgi:hypothetical protein
MTWCAKSSLFGFLHVGATTKNIKQKTRRRRMPQMEKRQKKNEFHLKTNASLTKSKRARRNGFVGKISERKRRVNDDE